MSYNLVGFLKCVRDHHHKMVNWPAVGAVLLPNLGGLANGIYFAGQVRVGGGLQAWYDALDKPRWTPPRRAYAPVWTALYCAMGCSSYLVVKECGGLTGRAALPLALYGAQLLLNWAWTPIFFGKRDFKLAMIDISLLLATSTATTVAFWRVSPAAGALLLPYLAWLAGAAALTHHVWRNNPPGGKRD
ncbi:hypothetical protein JYU34_019672 [Plutella xylostella]|uniref:Peripheral-type benzodiazepine receptor n=1 Tax=Plutella xylostella TaxID=51655 RepID=A0ABQ7PXA9_PLUXY|nr:hypothetical protein JYU34_019672 [Plutella xylostella]